MSDAVNHPRHYAHPSGVECIEIAEHLGFNLGNAFKYVWRAGAKSEDAREDYAKALWYVERWRDQQHADRPRPACLQPVVHARLRRVLASEQGARRVALAAIASAWDARLVSHTIDAIVALRALRDAVGARSGADA